MDKQGALYFKLVTGVFLLILAGYGVHRLWWRGPAYELYSTQICEVGDGMTVSGFVVRSESLLICGEPVTFTVPEGQWVGGGQAVATSCRGSLVVPQGGYVSHRADGYEEVLTPSFLLSCKAEDLDGICPRPLPENTVGRLIRGQTWYFAAGGDFPALEQGQDLRLQIGALECEASVLRTQGLLLLECRDYGHRVTELRQCEARLITGTLEAIALPGEAVYYEEGEACVYLLQGGRARRKRITLLRAEEAQVWVDPETLPPGAQVILTEIELSDGMVLK